MKNKEKYLDLLKQRYKKLLRYVNSSKRKMGIELEFQVIPKNGSKPDLNILKNLLNEFLPSIEFTKAEFDYDGNCIKGSKNGDVICYEGSYALIEISLAPSEEINSISDKACFYINKIQSFLNKYDLTLVTIGAHPFDWSSELSYINNSKWQTYKHFFKDFNLKKEYSFYNTPAIFCSTQIHLDLSLQELPIYFNILNRLGWVKALLFANSPSVKKEEKRCFCVRDLIWQHSAFAFHPNNVGISDKTYNHYEDILLDTLNNSIFNVLREGKRIYFQPISLKDYLDSKSIKGWEVKGNEKVACELILENNDIEFSRPFNSIVVTGYGTAEIKSECIQPIEDLMAHLAFHVGIANNMDKIAQLLQMYSYSNSEFRKKAIYDGYDIQKDLDFNVEEFIFNLLELIKEGLILRNNQEEKYLSCLFKRLANKTNPANEFMKLLNQGYALNDIVNNNNLLCEV